MRSISSPLSSLARQLAAALVAACALSAQQPSATPLPAARDLVARFVDAIGGREALLRHASFRARGRFEMPAAGISGDLEIIQARPNRMAMRTTIPGIGEVASGFDGTIGWSMDPMQGPRLLAGAELAARRDEADLMSVFRDGESIASLSTTERVELGGQSCYKVKVSWKSGRESIDCYAVESGMLVATVVREESPMGTLEVTTLLADYKAFGGVRRPTRMTASAMGQQQVVTITSVEFDVVDASAFELPAAIRTLADKAVVKVGSNP